MSGTRARIGFIDTCDRDHTVGDLAEEQSELVAMRDRNPARLLLEILGFHSGNPRVVALPNAARRRWRDGCRSRTRKAGWGWIGEGGLAEDVEGADGGGCGSAQSVDSLLA